MKKIIFIALIIIVGLFFYCNNSKNTDIPNKNTEKQSTFINIKSIKHDVKNANPDITYRTGELRFYNEVIESLISYKESIDFKDDFEENSLLIKENPYAKILGSYKIVNDKIIFQYNYSFDQHMEIVKYLDNEFLSIINKNIKNDMSNIEKVLVIYKYLGKRIKYDIEWDNNHFNTFSSEEADIYNGLKDNKGVCHTYVYLLQFLLYQLDIKSSIISGKIAKSNDYHVWLSVKMNDLYYHLDLTWDATSDDDSNTVSLKYFGLNNEENIERTVYYNDLFYNENNPIIANKKKSFSEFRSVIDYEVLGENKIEVITENGNDTIDISKYDFS